MIDVIAFADTTLEGTKEFSLGMRELRRRLPAIRRWWWYTKPGKTVPENAISVADFPASSDVTWVLVVVNPAILVSDNLVSELLALAPAGEGAVCVLPADPRGFAPGVMLDYASRPGFDRFVARLGNAPRQGNYDGRSPWIYLVAREALAELAASHGRDLLWPDVPALLGTRTVIANHAFAHSYADYHLNSRAEMLRLLPENVHTLLDVGGGAGNFARAFMAERGGQATLLEFNPGAAETARERGLEVLTGDFCSTVATQRFDCVAMLDVLEHLADPLDALVHARQFLQPGGVLLLSLPNVGHWSVVWDLLEGKFDYQPVGILCNTHLRFFTRHGLQTLLGEAGFRVERWENMPSPPPEPFASFLGKHATLGVTPDLESLATESFHVLARHDR